MTSKEIMQALLDGKKVGDVYDYIYLNMDGELMLSNGDDGSDDPETIGKMFTWYGVTVQPEEGP